MGTKAGSSILTRGFSPGHSCVDVLMRWPAGPQGRSSTGRDQPHQGCSPRLLPARQSSLPPFWRGPGGRESMPVLLACRS